MRNDQNRICMFSKSALENTKPVPEDIDTLFSRLKGNDTKYSINLIWLNRTLDINQEYIFRKHKSSTILDSAAKWQVENPNAKINIWYDGLLSTLESIN